MDSAVYASYRYSRRARAGSRLRWALAVSVFSHLLFLAALESEVPQRRTRVVGAAPIRVRLEPLPWVPPAGPAVADLYESPLPRRIAPRPAAARGERPAVPRAEVAATTPDPGKQLALPQVPDPTVYTARDLDSYPRPVASLDAGRLEDPAGKSVSVQFELIIDERGVVNNVALAGPGPAGQLETELRAMLAAARFIPARKDGHAVKSRIVLRVDFHQKKREP